MGSEATLVACHVPGDYVPGRDLIIGFSGTMTLPWLMLFDQHSMHFDAGDDPASALPFLHCPRAQALARFGQRAERLAPKLHFIPDAVNCLGSFAAYLEALQQPFLEIDTWELWVLTVTNHTHASKFNAALLNALCLLESERSPIDRRAWTELLDWSQPSRTAPEYWSTQHQRLLFGVPSIDGPPRPWDAVAPS